MIPNFWLMFGYVTLRGKKVLLYIYDEYFNVDVDLEIGYNTAMFNIIMV